jgi:hypothetical protein
VCWHPDKQAKTSAGIANLQKYGVIRFIVPFIIISP